MKLKNFAHKRLTLRGCVSEFLEPALGELVDGLPLDLVDGAAHVEHQRARARVLGTSCTNNGAYYDIN